MYDNENCVNICEPIESAKMIVGETYKAEAEAIECLVRVLQGLTGNAVPQDAGKDPENFLDALRINRKNVYYLTEIAKEIEKTLFS